MKKKIVLLICTVLFCNMLGACGGSRFTGGWSGGISRGNSSTNNSIEESMSVTMDSAIPDGIYYNTEMTREHALEYNTEEYNHIVRNDFKSVATSPLSTFAMDIDTGSYPMLRKMVDEGRSAWEIPKGAIRTEEILNYFTFDFDNRVERDMFNVEYEIAECPWDKDNLVVAVTLNSKDISLEKQPQRNFVILFDTSGSMDDADKGFLALHSCSTLIDNLNEEDKISIVTYAGSSELILDGSSNIKEIDKALEEVMRHLEQGGGTNGSGGITAAYEVAKDNFIPGGNNRVIIFSDGDMNLGITDQTGLIELVEGYAKDENIFLTTLGFGTGNYSDANMEQIANKGNGSYYYIDCLSEGRRVLRDRLNQSTQTVAKDAKIQVEFNPLYVSEYRLLGYENRAMADEDFADDTKDGGEVGPNQSVTVLYEIKPTSGEVKGSNLKYQEAPELSEEALVSTEILTLSVRYKEPEGDKSTLEEFPVIYDATLEPSEDFYFACGIASLVDSIMNEDNLDDAYRLLKDGNTSNVEERKELITIVDYLRDN